MHKYLRAIGFSQFESKKQIDNFFKDNLQESNLITSYQTLDKRIVGQYNIMVTQNAGISIISEENKEIDNMDFYFPFSKGYDYSIVEECTVERHSDKESYAGIIDDYRLGMAIIFYMTNINSYDRLIKKHIDDSLKFNKIFLSALSLDGTIILPVENKQKSNVNFETIDFNKNNNDTANVVDTNVNISNQTTLIGHNKNDEIIYPSYEYNVYKTLAERYKKEDLFSIVESSIVPYGIECDKYLVVANILNVSKMENKYSNELVYDIRVETLGLKFNIIINEKDLIGEPKAGRRFRGTIWLMGDIEFVSKHI